MWFLLFASCEDKEKSKNTTTAIPPASSELREDSISQFPGESAKETPVKQAKREGPLIIQEELIPFLTRYGEENPENLVRISTRFGDIEVQLYRDTPLHRANFIFLVKKGYFDATVFHRVASGFVIQGGNADNRETHFKRSEIGSFLIPAEFGPGHRHTRGAFSAAKYLEQNVSNASSPFEFFIVQSEKGAHHLNNEHTVYGRVTKGMDVVDEIAEQEVDDGEWPLSNIHIKVEIMD